MLHLFLLGTLMTGCSRTNRPVAVVNGYAISESAFAAALPASTGPGQDSAARQRLIESMVNHELFVTEAVRQGLDSVIAYPLELEQKGLVVRELFKALARQTSPVTAMDLESAYRLLSTEDRCRVVVVPEESLALAREIVRQLDSGTPFESLASRHSVHRSGAQGGDIGYVEHYYIDEPVLQALLLLKPGEYTGPVRSHETYQVVQLLDRRPVESLPPFGQLKQRLEVELSLQREREAATKYVADLRGRLRYNPEGLAVFQKPAEQIVAAEMDVWVAIKDGKQYVKVERLMHVARRLPADLDTALRTMAVKRAIEEDLAYDDGLGRGLHKLPEVRAQLEDRRRKLLYQELYRREVTDRVTVTDAEVQDTFAARRDRYAGNDLGAVAPLIRNDLLAARRAERYNEYLAELRERARITVDEKRLYRAAKPRQGRKQ